VTEKSETPGLPMKIGKFNFTWPLTDANLTTRFAIQSFLCVSIMTVTLWFIVSNYLINAILEREWQTTAQVVRGDVKKLLDDYDFKAEDRKSVGFKFETLLKHMRLIPDIIRFKVYNPRSVVIWSDDKRLVGKSFAENDRLQDALKGEIVADLSSLEKKGSQFDHESGSVEVYVPIYSDKTRELLGVMETYKRADPIYAEIRNARMVVLLGALGGGLLLYLSLFAIVRQAARKIADQQQNLINMHSELVALQRMAAVGEMAAAVAHGIGNPLSSIRAAAQVATLDCNSTSDTELGSKMRVSLGNIMEQVDRVQKRMQGLLNFAKPMEPHPVPVELNVLIRDVVETLRSRFADAAVKPSLELASDIPKLALDVNQAEQIFMGLITNALEATPKNGTVTVRTKAIPGNGSSPSVVVSVEDTGEGIPVENRQKVFEPFFTTKSHGTGIGLPLAKKFVERNGGVISISDGLSGGAKVDVHFPWQPVS
jgi:two-component system, NtrC family, sensor histidine kinase HydH